MHFWPFDGWDIPAGQSAIAEVYPALWSRGFANEGRTGDQHDAFSIAAWLSRADRDGSLAALLNPDLSPAERTLAQVEGWILGVPGLIRTGKTRDDSTACAHAETTRHLKTLVDAVLANDRAVVAAIQSGPSSSDDAAAGDDDE